MKNRYFAELQPIQKYPYPDFQSCRRGRGVSAKFSGGVHFLKCPWQYLSQFSWKKNSIGTPGRNQQTFIVVSFTSGGAWTFFVYLGKIGNRFLHLHFWHNQIILPWQFRHNGIFYCDNLGKRINLVADIWVLTFFGHICHFVQICSTFLMHVLTRILECNIELLG